MWKFVLFMLQGIPEMTGAVALCMVLSRVNLSWKKALIVGSILSLFIYFIKLTTLSWGFHCLFALFMLIICLFRYFDVSLFTAFTVSIISQTLLLILENFFFIISFYILDLNKEMIMSNQFYWFVQGLPQALIMLGLAFYMNKKLNHKQYQHIEKYIKWIDQ